MEESWLFTFLDLIDYEVMLELEPEPWLYASDMQQRGIKVHIRGWKIEHGVPKHFMMPLVSEGAITDRNDFTVSLWCVF